MSRRAPPNAANAQRAAQNQQTIKALLKLEGNKSCADCKRNKHPRWASWNLGIFVCIRCSGIHRGMGTHISRVKSVDLDAWTDEQLQSVLRWGNTRANKYWEGKLADGHIPSEVKIENFIRTKYESKRWVMDGPMPDPATLDTDGDDDVPLNVVQEKAKLDRASSQRAASTSVQPLQPPAKSSQPIDLFGDVPTPPARPSTTDPAAAQLPPSRPPVVNKSTKASDSLLGLDFFGGPSAPPSARPASAASLPAGTNLPSRPDLKQSILSLYASAPKPQPAQPAPQHDRQGSFGGLQSPPVPKPSSFGGLDDAFGGLSFGSQTPAPAKPAQQSKPDAFASFSSAVNRPSNPAAPQLTSPLSGGGFFDTGPKPASKTPAVQKPAARPQAVLSPLESNDFGDFSFAPEPTPPKPQPSNPKSNLDLFSMDEPVPTFPASKTTTEPTKSAAVTSPFNLSAASAAPEPAKKTTSVQNTNSANFGAFSNTDAWGSSDAWSTPDPAPAQAAKPKASSPPKAPAITMHNDFSAWGGSEPVTNQPSALSSGLEQPTTGPPKVTQDEDFGGWSSSAPVAPAAPAAPATTSPPLTSSKPSSGGFGGGDDLYSNVWG